MKKVEEIFKKGEWIVHCYHGVGQVKGIDTKRIQGKNKVFIKVKTNAFTYWLPIFNINSKNIRKISAASTFNKALSIIRKKPEPLNADYRMRKEQIKKEIAKGSLIPRAKLIRNLFCKQKINRSYDEEITLEKLKNQFINEWTVASNINKKIAQQKLNKALLKSAANLTLEYTNKEHFMRKSKSRKK
ncbi:MAG TPA: hypothetical protein G4N92_03250 [Anaerolineae bacterium]|nr:hypothetical protein [Anaerolineae bacterium]